MLAFNAIGRRPGTPAAPGAPGRGCRVTPGLLHGPARTSNAAKWARIIERFWRSACLGRRPAHPRLLGAGHHPPSPRASRWLRCWMSARLRGRERLLAVAMGYGVIGSPTGSGPVSLGSSPGTPAEAGFLAHWPLANFAGARSAFPGGRPPGPPEGRVSLLIGRWPISPGARSAFPGGRPPGPPEGRVPLLIGRWPISPGGRSAFPGDDPPDPPLGPFSAGGLGSVGPVSSRPNRRGLLPGAPPDPEAGFAAHWPLANFAGGPQCFPGGTTPRTPRGAGFAAHWPLANFAGGPQCFPGGTTPRTPRGAGSPSHWPLANFAGGPQCFPGGRPPGPPAWPTLGWWAGVRRPGFVPSEPAWAPPGGAPGPGGGFRCSLAAGQFRPGPAVLSRGDELSRGNDPRPDNPGSRVTRKRPPGTLGMGVPGDSGVGKVGRGLRGPERHPRPRRGGYEDGDVWVAAVLALWLVPRPWGPDGGLRTSVPGSAGWSARGLVRGIAGPGSWRRRLRLTQGRAAGPGR